MITAIEQVDFWRGCVSENPNLEFEVADNRYDTRKSCRYCVAIGSGGDGHLMHGVADRLSSAVLSRHTFSDTKDISEQLFIRCFLYEIYYFITKQGICQPAVEDVRFSYDERTATRRIVSELVPAGWLEILPRPKYCPGWKHP